MQTGRTQTRRTQHRTERRVEIAEKCIHVENVTLDPPRGRFCRQPAGPTTTRTLDRSSNARTSENSTALVLNDGVRATARSRTEAGPSTASCSSEWHARHTTASALVHTALRRLLHSVFCTCTCQQRFEADICDVRRDWTKWLLEISNLDGPGWVSHPGACDACACAYIHNVRAPLIVVRPVKAGGRA